MDCVSWSKNRITLFTRHLLGLTWFNSQANFYHGNCSSFLPFLQNLIFAKPNLTCFVAVTLWRNCLVFEFPKINVFTYLFSVYNMTSLLIASWTSIYDKTVSRDTVAIIYHKQTWMETIEHADLGEKSNWWVDESFIS